MRRVRMIWGLFVVLALFAAACGDDDDGAGDEPNTDPTEEPDGEPSEEPDGEPDEEPDGEPQSGGTISIGTFTPTPSFDPLTNIGTGVTGGMEMAALYDTLMVYDPDTGEYEPRLAESLTPNDDNTEWTLELRPDITFTDGTDYDAEAVVFNLQRQIDEGGRSASLLAAIDSLEVVDPLTVRIEMARPNSTVPFMLASAPGMIASPTAIESLGEDFGVEATGAGAGPFTLVDFRAGEVVILERNPDYWGGEVYLDELRFVNLGGQEPTFEALRSGELDAALLRDPEVVSDAMAEGFDGLEAVQSAGNTVIMNNGVTVTCQDGEPAALCEGEADGTSVPSETVTDDARVRRAVAAAFDHETIRDRVFGGADTPFTSTLFTDLSRWHMPGLEGPEFDLDRASELVEEVQADTDWDGSIRVSCHNGMPDWGVAVEAMLERAGFDVDLEDSQDVSGNISAVVVRKEFDLACFGISILDEEPFHAIQREFGLSGYDNPEVNEALAAGLAASTDEERQEALRTIVEDYNENVPFLSVNPVVQMVALTDGLEGVTQTVASIALFDDAWLS